MAFMQRIRRGGLLRRQFHPNGTPSQPVQPSEPQFQFPLVLAFAPREVYQISGDGLHSAPSHPCSIREAYYTAFLLTRKLVRDLAPRIMDYAEYWPAQETSFDVGRMITSAPEGMAVLATPPLTAQQARRIRRVTFTVTSHDQGWGGEPENQGTLQGSWTWFEAHVRPRGTAPYIYADGPWKRLREGAPRNEGVNPWDPFNGRRLISNYTAVGEAQTQSTTWRYDADADRDCGGDEDQAQEQRDILRNMSEGDQIVLTAHAAFPEWINYVDRVSIVLEFGYVR